MLAIKGLIPVFDGEVKKEVFVENSFKREIETTYGSRMSKMYPKLLYSLRVNNNGKLYY